ncbi:carboxymuconolactone decarboxylase family protein [Rhodovibrio salinarum]|uniref:Carboxymuconolactone decarboxylase family protein n=1 Tax=Rhodovibrio salinarum TaxID=1087 RepID=A0A934V1C7_9PROT|nr:carboxymuconolactone decarboxylase family protein [Rhodovibrio salinarum]MBK1699282.1 carboxymuconolactone decarboxylase family protein [Rhodovibrio salinarum]
MTSMVTLIDYEHAAPRVRAVYDDIMATRKTNHVNNFWRALAHDPETLEATWTRMKRLLGSGSEGTLDPLTKELIYLAVSISNGCEYCVRSHAAAAQRKGLTEAQYTEMLAVVGLANETNRLAVGYQVPVDDSLK